MAYDFTPASNHFIDWGNFAAMHNRDYSVSLWAYRDDTENLGYLIGKTDGSSGFYLRGLGGSEMNAGHNSATHLSTTGNALPNGVWTNLILTFKQADGDMFLYANASEVAQNLAVTTMTSTSAVLGVGNRAANDRDWDGRICEVAVWLDHVLTASQREMLAKGYSPLFIRPQPSLYAPMIRELYDVRGKATPTNTNATPAIAHPRIFYLKRRPIALGVGGGGGGGGGAGGPLMAGRRNRLVIAA